MSKRQAKDDGIRRFPRNIRFPRVKPEFLAPKDVYEEWLKNEKSSRMKEWVKRFEKKHKKAS